MKNTTQTTLTTAMQPKSIQKTCKTLSSSLEDFLAKLSVLLENEKDLTIQEERYFLRLQGFSETKDPNIFFSKMLKVYYLMKGGATLQTIFGVCDELGYDVSWAIYNSKDYGVPQNRERIFLKGYFREKCGQEILFKTRNSKKSDGKLIKLNNKKQAQEVFSIDGIAKTLIANGGGQGGKTGLYQIDDNRKATVTRNGDFFALTTRCRSMPFRKKQDNYIIENEEYKIRRLTPVECERLQGFPDNWTEYGANGEKISDTQRYKCIGNAVTTNVITAIVDEMFDGVDE